MMNAVEIFIGIIAFQFFLASSQAGKGRGIRSSGLRDDGKKTIAKSSLMFGGLLASPNYNEKFNDNLI